MKNIRTARHFGAYLFLALVMGIPQVAFPAARLTADQTCKFSTTCAQIVEEAQRQCPEIAAILREKLDHIKSDLIQIAAIGKSDIARGPVSADYHQHMHKLKYKRIMSIFLEHAEDLIELAKKAHGKPIAEHILTFTNDLKALCAAFDAYFKKHTRIEAATLLLNLKRLQESLNVYAHMLPIELKSLSPMAWQTIIRNLHIS
jgi:hypothetical protein